MVGPDSQPSPQPPSGHSHPGLTGRSVGWGPCLGLPWQEVGFKAAGMLRIPGGFWNCPWEVRKVPGFQQLCVVGH